MPRPPGTQALQQRPLLSRVLGALAAGALAAGCLGEGRPLEEYLRDYERYQPADAGSGTPDAGSAPADGGGSAPVCSRYDSRSTWVRFANRYTDRSVRYLWVDWNCREVLYRTLGPGQQVDQQTYVGHVWRVRSADGELLREHVAALSSTPVVVEVP